MLKIVPYESKYKTQWDVFIYHSCNGTIFHQQHFLGYHDKDKFNDLSMIIFDERDEIVSVFPAARLKYDIWSHPGASFGGPVIKQVGIETMLCIVDAIDQYAKQLLMKSIHMVLTPNSFHTEPVEGLEFALWHRGYRPEAIELSICVKLDNKSPVEFSRRRNRGIRKADRYNIEIKQSLDLEAYWFILENNLRIRHSTQPTHTVVEMEKLIELYPYDIKLFSAFHKNQMIAGIIVIMNNETSFETFYIAQDYKYEYMRAMDFLIHHIYFWGRKRSFKWMNFGITSEQHGKKINFGLAKFKEEFGGCDIVRRTYAKQL